MADRIEPGTYRHFKGGLYEVFCVARDTTDNRELVIYEPLDHPGWRFARELSEFAGSAPDGKGGEQPRFRRVTADD